MKKAVKKWISLLLAVCLPATAAPFSGQWRNRTIPQIGK